MERINFINNQTKASAETFNQLQDNIENAINDMSEIITLNTEIKTNKIIDGKSVYVKAVKFNSSASISISSNIDYVVDGRVFAKDNTNWRSIPWCYNDTDERYMGGWSISNSGLLIFQLGSGLSIITKGYAEIYYTKTTD